MALAVDAAVETNAALDDAPVAQTEEVKTDGPRRFEDPPALLAMLWFGFILVHVACLSMIKIAVETSFYIGFAADVAYLFFLIFLARTLGQTNRFRSFRSIVWILACVSVFTVGILVAEMVENRFGPPEIEGYGGGFVLLVLMLAMGPMMLLSLVILCQSDAKGSFLNFYYGILLTGLLIIELPTGDFPGLLEVVLTHEDLVILYLASTYLLVALVSLFIDWPTRFRSLKPWAAGCSLVPLWLSLHDIMGGFPSLAYTTVVERALVLEFKAFAVYSALALAQIVLALIIDELLPMILAGVSLLVVASQGSLMVGQAVYDFTVSSFPNAVELAEVAQLATLALLGAAVLFVSILFAFRRKAIEEMVNAGKKKLRRSVRGRAESNPTDTTGEATPVEVTV